MRLRSRSSMGDDSSALESEDTVNGLPSPSSGRSADAQSVPAQDRTARYSTIQYNRVPEGVADSTPEPSGIVAVTRKGVCLVVVAVVARTVQLP